MTHKPVYCQCCRSAIWFPSPNTWHTVASKLKSMGWHTDVKEGGQVETFCSDECKVKGPPKRVRESVTAFVRFEKGATITFKTGCQDSLYGYDPQSADEQYLAGFSLGNTLRAASDQFGRREDKASVP